MPLSSNTLSTGKPAVLEISLLGSFRVKVNGQPSTAFAYDKLRALLAYLATEPKTEHSRETLATLLWPEQISGDAKRNLRLALFNLRRVLGGTDARTPYLIATQKNLTLNPAASLWLDLTEFTAPMPNSPPVPDAEYCRLCVKLGERQVALYRGPFLDGLHVDDAQDFEDWVLAKRESLHRQALVLLERLTACHEQLGDYASALRHALRYTLLEPWDEGGHRRLMQLLALNGGSGAALAHYEATRRLLERDLGVTPEERTRALADAIRDGKFDPAEMLKPPAVHFPTSTAERRQVSVLYCELTLAAIDDPDEAMELLHAPQARCVEIIRQFSGHIVQKHGGGLLAYFGYPQAQEYAARRAVQAALAVTREAAHGIDIRASVHTGLVITGGEPTMPDTVGKTSRIAIELRHGVAHNEVAISHETHRMVAGYFDCVSLGLQSLAGIARPLEVFKVLRESGARSRLDAAAQLTPLAGRQAEIARLMGLWQETAQGARQVVLVQGEAGIGKSRLLHVLKERLADQSHAIRELRCFPEFSQSPFHPLIAAIEAILGLAHDDTSEARFDELASYLETHFPASAPEAVPLLAQLLSLPLAGPYRAAGLTPQKQKEQTIAVMLELLQRFATQQPVLFILEDLHWVDPSTLEFLTRFVEQTGSKAILALFTARAEFISPWNEGLGTTLTLAPLVEDEVVEMIASISAHIPATTLRVIVERADGVPLFAEEMAKIASMDNQASIPSTLHDLLMARLDAMGEAKSVAQAAATLGREFTLDRLRRVADAEPSFFTRSVDKLRAAGLLTGAGGDLQFKHILIQEAAYQSQTKNTRQATHRRIARVLREDAPDQIEAWPEILARHLGLGGEAQAAVDCWLKAGRHAARRFFNREAAAHFRAGLELIGELPDGPLRDNLEFQLLVGWGASVQATEGWGAADAESAFVRAMAISSRVQNSHETFQTLWGLWRNTSAVCGPSPALELAQNLLRLARQNQDRAQLIHAYFALGLTQMLTGDLGSARMHLAQGYQDYSPALHDALMRVTGEDSGFACGTFLSWVLWFSGYPGQARKIGAEALVLARQSASPNDLAGTLAFASNLIRWLGQGDAVLTLTGELLTLTEKHDLLQWRASGELVRGLTLISTGQPDGIGILKQGMVSLRKTIRGLHSSVLLYMAEAGTHDRREGGAAIAAVDESLERSANTGENYLNGELLRLKGECLLTLSHDNAAQAQTCFEQAIAINRDMHAKSFELRAAMSLARLGRQRGDGAEAKHLLEEVYNWFSEGFDSHDLTEAKALLESLEQPKP